MDGRTNGRLAVTVSSLESSVAEAVLLLESLNATCAGQQRLLESLLERVRILGLGQMDAAEAVHELKDRVLLQAQEEASILYALQAARTGSGSLSSLPDQRAYDQMVTRVRSLVHRHVPPDATVIVVSKGDDELLKLYGRRGWHFPREENGVYAGYHPHSGTSAIIHLEALRALGGQYFLLPATSAWWLDTYPEFRKHLSATYHEVIGEPDVGFLYALGERAANPESRSVEEFQAILEHCRDCCGVDRPDILDWDTGLGLADLLPDAAVFDCGFETGQLPYLEDSVAIVALRSVEPADVAEAERVARLAVANVAAHVNGPAASVYDGPVQTRVTWVAPFEPDSELTSIVIPCYNQLRYTRMCLAAVAEKLPAGAKVEVVVVDDGSTDGSFEWLTEHARKRDWLRVVRNEVNSGFVEAVNLGAQASRGELLVLLNNDCLPLPDWLQALRRTFRQRADAGAVGGKLVFPDGRLQEAGGVVFRDGTAAKIGYRDIDVNAPLYNFVRRVDYCSGALLATPRALFLELGGLDQRYAPAYYEDTDYCFKVRERGLEVYYQNESAAIHVEGATTGKTVRRGAKRYQLLNHEKFVERWGPVLAEHLDRPSEPFSATTLHRLVHADRRLGRP